MAPNKKEGSDNLTTRPHNLTTLDKEVRKGGYICVKYREEQKDDPIDMERQLGDSGDYVSDDVPGSYIEGVVLDNNPKSIHIVGNSLLRQISLYEIIGALIKDPQAQLRKMATEVSKPSIVAYNVVS